MQRKQRALTSIHFKHCGLEISALFWDKFPYQLANSSICQCFVLEVKLSAHSSYYKIQTSVLFHQLSKFKDHIHDKMHVQQRDFSLDQKIGSRIFGLALYQIYFTFNGQSLWSFCTLLWLKPLKNVFENPPKDNCASIKKVLSLCLLTNTTAA